MLPNSSFCIFCVKYRLDYFIGKITHNKLITSPAWFCYEISRFSRNNFAKFKIISSKFRVLRNFKKAVSQPPYSVLFMNLNKLIIKYFTKITYSSTGQMWNFTYFKVKSLGKKISTLLLPIPHPPKPPISHHHSCTALPCALPMLFVFFPCSYPILTNVMFDTF